VAEFSEQLNQLFDIAHVDAMSKIKIEQDKEFLNDQRNDRKMIMTTEDKELAEKQQRSKDRRDKEEERKRKASLQSASAADANDSDDGKSSDVSDNTDSCDEYTPSKAFKSSATQLMAQTKKKTSRDQLFNADVTSPLDRNKTSSREAVRLMIPIAAALGHDPNDLPISRNTIQRARTSARHEMSKAIMDNFEPICPLVLHWDGKILPEIVGEGSIDRLPVLVSGDGMDKTLGCAKSELRNC